MCRAAMKFLLPYVFSPYPVINNFIEGGSCFVMRFIEGYYFIATYFMSTLSASGYLSVIQCYTVSHIFFSI